MLNKTLENPMNPDTELSLRIKMGHLKKGDTIRFKVGEGSYHYAKNVALNYSKVKRWAINIEPIKTDGIQITLVDYTDGEKYPMDELTKKGDSKEFNIEPSKEQSLRSKASRHAKQIGLSSKVTRVKPGILVVELVDTNQDRIKKTGTKKTIDRDENIKNRPLGRHRFAANKLKYPIGDLAIGQSVLVNLKEKDHHKLRLYVSGYTKRNGQKMTCNAKENGILVTRTA